MKPTLAVVTRDPFVTWEMKALHRASRGCRVELVRVDPTRWSFDVTRLTFQSPRERRKDRDATFHAALGRVDQDALLDGCRVLHLLEGAGVPTINGASSVRLGRDKALTSLVLAQENIPQPDTQVLSPLPPSRLHALSYPVVVKPLVGGQGSAVSRASGPKELAILLRDSGGPMIVQPFVRGILRELRAVILEGRVLATVAKEPPPGDWRANLTLGATAVTATADSQTERAACAAALAVKAEFAAVDVLETDRGPLVIDVNVCPGFQHVVHATGCDIAEYLIASLRNKMRRLHGPKDQP